MNFNLEPSEILKLQEWKERNDTERLANGESLYEGAAGGRFTYCFTPTDIGLLIKITDNLCNKSIDLTDYDSW